MCKGVSSFCFNSERDDSSHAPRSRARPPWSICSMPTINWGSLSGRYRVAIGSPPSLSATRRRRGCRLAQGSSLPTLEALLGKACPRAVRTPLRTLLRVHCAARASAAQTPRGPRRRRGRRTCGARPSVSWPFVHTNTETKTFWCNTCFVPNASGRVSDEGAATEVAPSPRWRVEQRRMELAVAGCAVGSSRRDWVRFRECRRVGGGAPGCSVLG